MRRRFMQDSRIDVNKYLTFVARENNTSISLWNYKSIGNGGFSDIQYSINGEHFIEGDVNNIIINSGETFSVKATYHVPQADHDGVFIISRPVDVIGTISSILATLNCYNYIFYNAPIVDASLLSLPATTLWDNCYAYMFYGCTSLITAPELPATALAENCYNGMFYGCTSLITAPELPATALAGYCYNSMFRGCTSLTTAPELPATTLVDDCYYGMFSGCTSLTTAPALPATTLANSCYDSMFQDCTGLTTAPTLPATILADSCYDSMFNRCTSLTTVPELPATTLASWCYCDMFKGCTSLTTAPELPATPATRLADYCYSYMFSNCTSLTTAPALPATKLGIGCYSNMFNGCTSLTTAPELPAISLINNCYIGMFRGCSKLNYIKMLATTNISATGCLSSWVSGVASTGTFVKHPNMTSLPIGISGIPEGWTVVNDGEDSVNLITFTIDGTEYQAEEGMTWEEWINSEYNIDMTFGIDEFEGTSITNGSMYIGTLTEYVEPSDLIIANYEYILTR